MSILYELVSVNSMKDLSPQHKKDLISEIIMSGNWPRFMKFKEILDGDINDIITSDEILGLIPMLIDIELFQYILDRYDFKQGQQFFYNYALYNNNDVIKEMVYNYFVDNYSHIMIDKMEMYETLIEK